VYTGPITISPNVGDITGNSLSLFAFDTIKLGSRWELIGGLRWEYFGVDGVNTTPAPVRRVDRMLSGRSSVVYKPATNGSIYFSYGTSLNPSLEGLSYGTADQSIKPERNYSTEVGTKWGLIRDRILVSGALFQIVKTNARTPGIGPNDPPVILDGKQRVNGLELSATGNLTRALHVFTTYNIMDHRITESNNPNELGKRLAQTPRNSFSAWSTYQTPWRLSLGGGLRYVGKRYNNTSNVRFVDGYWTADAMVGLQVTEQVDIRVNISNLTDAYYFDRVGGGHVIPGPALTVMMVTNFRF
jgi:catecholate siderophore receptor